LLSRLPEVQDLVDTNCPSVCALVETGDISSSLSGQWFPGYHRFFTPGSNSHGGVLVLVHNSITYAVKYSEVNLIALTIPLGLCTLSVIACYSPPDSTLPTDTLKFLLDGSPTLLLGDFNAKSIDWNCTHNNARGRVLQNIIEECELHVGFVDRPTSKRSKNVIDLIITSFPSPEVSVLSYGTSDHWPVLFTSPWFTSSSFSFKEVR
ncbi:unnamed protein product, partial [Didymodactylos carnosus]